MTTAPYRENPPADVLLDVSDLDDEFARPAPVQPRDGRDRPLIVPVDGGTPIAYQRASTFANVLTDQSGLTTWKIRHAVHGVAINAALTARAAASVYGDTDLDVVIEDGLLLDGASDAAGFGTAFHRFTEPDARDRIHEAPETIRADVVSFWETMDANGLTIVATEQFVVNDEYRVAGTFDHIVELPGGLGRVAADKKTGKYKPREHAVQLTVYAGGVLYAHTPPTGGEWTREDGVVFTARRARLDVRQDLALVIHTPHGEGRTELHWVRLDRGREAIERALWLRDWRSAKDVDLGFREGLARMEAAVATPAPRPAPVPSTGRQLQYAAEAAQRARWAARAAPTTAHEVVEDRRVQAFGEGTEPVRTAETIRRQIEAERAAPVPATASLGKDALLDAVAHAASTDAIGALYAAHRDQWDPDVRELARARKALLDGSVV